MIKSAAQKNLLKTAAQNAQLLKTAGQKRDYLKRPVKILTAVVIDKNLLKIAGQNFNSELHFKECVKLVSACNIE